jgi:hypothetical protein
VRGRGKVEAPLVKIDHGSHQEAIPKEVRGCFPAGSLGVSPNCPYLSPKGGGQRVETAL